LTGSGKKLLPTNAAECRARGWDEVDIVLVTGDAYVDHPSFGVAIIGRWLEAHGFRVAILAQPDWRSEVDFRRFWHAFSGSDAGRLEKRKSASEIQKHI